MPHYDALVLTLYINNFDMHMVLIDPDSATDLLQLPIFKQIKLSLDVALSVLALSKDQMWLLAWWHFQKTRLVALSLLELSKDQTCGSKLSDTFKRPDMALSLLALSKN